MASLRPIQGRSDRPRPSFRVVSALKLPASIPISASLHIHPGHIQHNSDVGLEEPYGQTNAQCMTSAFLDLPAEIRQHIYQYVLVPLSISCATISSRIPDNIPQSGHDSNADRFELRIYPTSLKDGECNDPGLLGTKATYDQDESDADAPLIVIDSASGCPVPQDRRFCPFNRAYEAPHFPQYMQERFRGIALTNKLIHEETTSLLYENLTWSFTSPESLCPLLANHYVKRNDVVRRIELSWDTPMCDWSGLRDSSLTVPTATQQIPSDEIISVEGLTQWYDFWERLSQLRRLEYLKVHIMYHASIADGALRIDDDFMRPVMLINGLKKGNAEFRIRWKSYVGGIKNAQSARTIDDVNAAVEDQWTSVPGQA